MANLGLKLGQWVNVSLDQNGYICADRWGTSDRMLQGQVIGFDGAGYPLLRIPGAGNHTGTWDVYSEKEKERLGIAPEFRSQIPLNNSCLFSIFDKAAFRALDNLNNNTAGQQMKHNLKVGDRIVVGMQGGQSQPLKYNWGPTAAPITATVIGQDSAGKPILYFDTNPGYSFMWSWEYQYGNDLSMIDPSWKSKINIYDKRAWIMQDDNTAFISEADYKAGKRPPAQAMTFQTMQDTFGFMIGSGNQIGDSKEFMRHLANALPDDQDSFLYGEQFGSLLNRQMPIKHEVFIKDKRSAQTFITTLRSTFSESNIIHNGAVESNDPDLQVEEYLIKWRHNDTIYRNFKVHVVTSTTMKNPFEKGGVDVSAFQMFRKDQLVKNFATKDFSAVVANTMKKQFTAFGAANKVLIEEIIKKGFSDTGKTIKETNKAMSNTTNGNGTAPSFAQMMKDDFHKATYRVAADQITHGIKEGIVHLLKSKGAQQSQLEGMTMLLDSEIGEAAIAMLAGLGLTYAPMVSTDPRAQKLAGEFRVNGMAKAGNVLVETLIGSFLPIVQGALANLPAEEGQVRVAETAPPARIAAPANSAEREAAEEEANAAPAEPKKAVA